MQVTKDRLIQKIAEAIQVHEGWFLPGVDPRYPNGSRSFRNNNPGNLKWIGQKGSIGMDAQGFAIFPDYETGFAALKYDIEYKIFVRKIPNLLQFFQRYAPASDGNNVKAYARAVLSRLEDYGPPMGWTIETPFDDMIGPKFEKISVEPKKVRIKFVANCLYWERLAARIEEVKLWFMERSEGKIELEFDVEHVCFQDVPFIPYPPFDNIDGVAFDWYDEHVTPLGKGYHAVMLFMDVSQWRARVARGWRTDAETGTVELQAACAENTREQIVDGNGRLLLDDSEFLAIVRHEIMHALFMMTGQEDTTHHWYDRTLALDNAIKEIIPDQLDRLLNRAGEFHYTFNENLVYGMRNKQVAALQKALKLDGIFPDSVPETGYYGPITAKAVFSFWKKYGIASWLEMYVYASTKGGRCVGPKTREKLNFLFG